jgi:hypothetical protein
VTTTFQLDRVAEPLAAFATIPEWLAAPMRPGRVADSLSRHVPELAEGRCRLLHCTPQRLRAKGSEWLVRYTARIEEPGKGPSDLVLAGELHAPGRPFPRAGTTAAATTPFGRPGWSGVLPDLRLELRAQDTDEALPALPLLVEPRAAADLLRRVLRRAGADQAPAIVSCDPVVVRYKPGSRCTVVVHVQYAEGIAGPTPIVLKTHQGDKGESAWAAMNALWDRPEQWREVVSLAEPIGYLPDERILVQGPVPEELTLKELARHAVAEASPAKLQRLRDELAATARGLAAVHRSGATYGRVATLDEELTEVAEVVERLGLSVPQLAMAAAPLLQLLRERSAAEPSDPIVSAHHDFRPAQVLLHHGEIGFIDFDGACMAEPALDLGRFRAKLRDIGISALGVNDGALPAGRVAENLALLDDLCEHFLVEYQKHAQVSRRRVLLWELCDLTTTMLHAWTKVRLQRIEPRLTILLHRLRAAGL